MHFLIMYIKDFSRITVPLTNLTKKEVKWEWTDKCQAAFEELKYPLCTAPILAYPKPDLKYILDTDANDVGVSAVLSQVQEGHERVIAYGSQRLNNLQERYSVTRKEQLRTVRCCGLYAEILTLLTWPKIPAKDR